MADWYPGLTRVIDNGYGGSRAGSVIEGAVIHHTANGGGVSALDYVANANSRNSHPTYLIQNSGQAYGIVHPDRRPYSTGGVPDPQAVSFEVDNSAGAPNWPTSPDAKETVAQIIAYHYMNSRRFGHGIALNIVGQVQAEFFIAWHSQYGATACPGPDMVNGGIQWIIARAMQIAHPDGAAIPAVVTPAPPQQAAPAPAASFDQTTKDRQAWLNASRNAGLAVDGIEGPMTRAAYKAYQTFLRAWGYTGAIDGIWGAGTQTAHQKYFDAKNSPAAPAPAAPAGNATTASFGRVDVVQRALKTKYPLYAGKLVVDNIDGPATKAAVKEFQRRAGLVVDGIAGPATRRALGL